MPTQVFEDANWPRAKAWLAGEHSVATLGKLAVIGAPLRLGSIIPGRTDLAPQAVREILAKFSCYDVEADVDLSLLEARDFGDLNLAELRLEEVFEPLSKVVQHALKSFNAVILLGGSNGVTRPGCQGAAKSLKSCGLLTFDAQFDLRDLGGGLSNENSVRSLLADGLPGANIVQLGIQSFANSRVYTQLAREAGITFVTMNQIREQGIEGVVRNALDQLAKHVETIYVDFDLNVLDRAFAPACSGSRPGGLTPWELKRAAWLCGNHPKVRVLDLVEVDPPQDLLAVTVMTMAECFLAFAAGLLSRLIGVGK